jgi:hypothetical protein
VQAEGTSAMMMGILDCEEFDVVMWCGQDEDCETGGTEAVGRYKFDGFVHVGCQVVNKSSSCTEPPYV